jgi:hypothetical protein
MSITFYLKTHSNRVELPDPAFNPLESEDPIYNPRTVSEAIYPELNLANAYGIYILKLVKLVTEDQLKSNDAWVGEINKNILDDFTKSLTFLILDIEKDKVPEVYNPVYTLNKIKQLQRICYYAIALNDTVVWS